MLGTLQDKIELNRRMNETLETMAWAIFKSWFVDFDPVREKAEGRDLGLPKRIADLFPDRFEDSELGKIPAGWELKPLPEFVEVNPPRSLRRGEVAPDLDMANMPIEWSRARCCDHASIQFRDAVCQWRYIGRTNHTLPGTRQDGVR